MTTTTTYLIAVIIIHDHCGASRIIIQDIIDVVVVVISGGLQQVPQTSRVDPAARLAVSPVLLARPRPSQVPPRWVRRPHGPKG